MTLIISSIFNEYLTSFCYIQIPISIHVISLTVHIRYKYSTKRGRLICFLGLKPRIDDEMEVEYKVSKKSPKKKKNNLNIY